MKLFILILSTLLIVSCGDEKETTTTSNTENVQRTDLLVSTEGRDFLLPHLKEVNLEEVTYNEDIYASIEELKKMTKEFREDGIDVESKLNHRELIFARVDKIISDNHDLAGNESVFLNDFLIPISEILDYILESDESQVFNSRIDELDNYLSNFSIIFPKK